MSGLWRGLLAVSLLLMTVAFACAETPTESVASIQPQPSAPGFASSSDEGRLPEPKTVGAEGTGTAAPELIKVSSLEPIITKSAAVTAEDRQMELRKADFLKFAESKLKEMNRNHILSRERMRIEKRPDGSYQASFHQLDDSSISCQVSRSPTKAAQYVAVLSYKERVYRASCASPAACKQGDFTPVEVIPNRHIFVHTNGVWQ